MLDRDLPIIELLTGTAHDSRPTDCTAPLHQRFAGRTIMLVAIANEFATVCRVTWRSGSDEPEISHHQQVQQRALNLGAVLDRETKACDAKYVVLCLHCGWSLELGQVATRTGHSDDPFGRYKLMLEQPMEVLPKGSYKYEQHYAAVDHPTLDRSLVFSVRRTVLDELVEEVRRAGLTVAAIRCGVAAMAELWFASTVEAGLDRDLLITDGCSATLLNVVNKDFTVVGHGNDAKAATQPRQSSQDPSRVGAYIVEVAAENLDPSGEHRPTWFIGSKEEYEATVNAQNVGPTFLSLPSSGVLDPVRACLHPRVSHDLNPSIKPERAPIPKGWRKLTYIYGLSVIVCILWSVTCYSFATRDSLMAVNNETAFEIMKQRKDAAEVAVRKQAQNLLAARQTRRWVANNYHAQTMLLRVLSAIPEKSTISDVSIQSPETGAASQITVKVSILGDELRQIAEARDAIERVLTDKQYRTRISAAPTSAPVKGGTQYTWMVVMPPVDEGIMKEGLTK